MQDRIQTVYLGSTILAPMAMRTPAKEKLEEGPRRNSPFDVDLGGVKREELRAQRDALQVLVERLQEENRLKDTQIEVLRKLQKQETRSTRVERWCMAKIIPVFSAWCRVTAAARCERAVARVEQEAGRMKSLHAEKEVQVSALIDRMATVKANAHTKLSGLNEANRKLAAALELKDKQLVESEAVVKHLRRAASNHGEREVDLQLQLDRCERRGTRRAEIQRGRSSMRGDGPKRKRLVSASFVAIVVEHFAHTSVAKSR